MFEPVGQKLGTAKEQAPDNSLLVAMNASELRLEKQHVSAYTGVTALTDLEVIIRRHCLFWSLTVDTTEAFIDTCLPAHIHFPSAHTEAALPCRAPIIYLFLYMLSLQPGSSPEDLFHKRPDPSQEPGPLQPQSSAL